MNKTTLIQILTIFFFITLVINVGMHGQIIKQDKDIRKQAINWVNHHCPPIQQEAGYNFVFANTTWEDFQIEE